MLRFLLVLLLLVLPIALPATPDPDPARFAAEIAGFDEADAKSPPEKGGVVFAGSSSIRLMPMKELFPDLKGLNRGFGGSHISEVNHYLDRCVLRYEPSIVVFYCGTNDLWDKKSPDQVEEDFEEFRRRLFERLPEVRLIVMAIRPSPARESIRKIEAEMNERFRKIAEGDKRITYVSGSWDRFLDGKGEPIPELFVEDKLHMSAAGYRIWKELLMPLLPVSARD